jgi:hypothetical protein
MATWSYLERYHRVNNLEIDLREVGNYSPATAEGFWRWLGVTHCDTIVYIDVDPNSIWAEPCAPESNAVIGELLPKQSIFRLVERRELPDYACIISIWKR